MGNFLYGLGQKAFTHRWRVLVIWVIIIALLGLAAIHFIKPTSSTVSIPGTEAQKTLDRYSQLFPSDGKGSGRIVLASQDGSKLATHMTAIDSLAKEVSKVSGVTTAVTPFANPSALSSDQTIGYITVGLQQGNGSIPLSTIKAVDIIVNNYRKSTPLDIEMGGDLINKQPADVLGVGEISGVVLALMVLVITFGSLVAAGMPILVAIFTVGTSMAGLFSLSQVIDIDSTTPALAVMLGLAVGIDYSLFIVNRYRAFLLEGNSYIESIGRAIATAGNAVIFAASTVVIALASLAVVQIPFMTTMGLAAAATVALAATIAITLLPALIGFSHRRLFSRKTRMMIATAQAEGAHHTEHVLHTTFWYKLGSIITKRPIVTLILALLVISTIALPVFSLKLGLPVDEYAAKTSTQRKAYDLISKGFGPGANGPLLVVVEGLPAVNDADKAAVRQALLMAYQKQMTSQQAAQAAASPQAQQAAMAALNAKVDQYAPYYQLQQVAQKISSVANVTSATAVQVTDNGTKGVIQVTPSSGPSDQKTIDLITYLRDPAHQKQLAGSGVSLGITGSTALQLDINQKLANALPEYLLVVVGLSLILLIVAFRSILVPIKATLGFLLSVLAMFGSMVAVFQWGWFGISSAPGPLISFIPIIGIGILFGLAMDYEFFLVSGMHEAHQHTKNPHKAVMRGFSMGSKVVTAAGFIMISVFAGFISNSDSTIQSLGFGLALGIFVDAFIVRMTIVPAVMTLLGNAAWWLPKWLDKIIPHVSIEGDNTTKR